MNETDNLVFKEHTTVKNTVVQKLRVQCVRAVTSQVRLPGHRRGAFSRGWVHGQRRLP